MGHHLNIENGEASMMYVGTPPWHGLGTHLKEAPKTAAEALKAANLDWEVGLKPLYCMEDGVYYAVPERTAIVRLDKWGQEDCVPFGIVGSDYRVLQNRDAFQFFDLLAETKKVSFETAGALDQGERVWVLAKVAGAMEIKCDQVEKYLLFSTGHDGRTSVQIRFTPVRVVCQNTLIASLREGTNLFKIYHVPGMRQAVEKAKEAIERIFGEYAKLEATYKKLAERPLKTGELGSYLAAVFPDPVRKKGQSDGSYEVALAKARKVRNRAAKLFEAGKGNNEQTVKGTLWAAYNGVVELIDHHGDYASPWERMEATCFGEGERIKQTALKEAEKMLLTAA